MIKGIYKAGEEGAELAQAALKALGAEQDGLYEERNNNQYFEKLIEELGDSLAANQIVLDNCSLLFYNRVIERKETKYNILAKRLKTNEPSR